MSGARYLLDAWPGLRKQLRGRRRVLLSDFDGTLARIMKHHDAPKLDRRVKARLEHIARRDIVGIVTGRTVQDIRRRAGIRGIWYAGSHGYEICTPREKRSLRLSARERRVVAQVTRAVRQRLGHLPGVVLEPKPAMIAVHYRRAASDVRTVAHRALQEIAARIPGAMMLSGKKVWDLAPRRPAHRTGKWAAVKYILERVRHAEGRPLTLTYIGDDTTDEQVFRHMRGLSVVVGRSQKTAARYFLRSPREVAQFLEKWERL